MFRIPSPVICDRKHITVAKNAVMVSTSHRVDFSLSASCLCLHGGIWILTSAAGGPMQAARVVLTLLDGPSAASKTGEADASRQPKRDMSSREVILRKLFQLDLMHNLLSCA